MKTTHIWLTVLTIALILNAVTRSNVDGEDCTVGICKEHLDQTDGAFVDGTSIKIGENGLQIATWPISGDAIADNAITGQKIDSIFGTRTTQDTDNNTLVEVSYYKAQTDGFLMLYCPTDGKQWEVYTSKTDSTPDSGDTLAGVLSTNYRDRAEFNTIPITKDDYIQVYQLYGGSGGLTIIWMPIGSGGLVKQQ